MILVVLRVIQGGLLSVEMRGAGMKGGQMELNSELSSIQMSIHFLTQSSSLIDGHLFSMLLR
ncbi:hypothetical protein BBJ41_30265 [Burkholderia stabilis]|nr:hypothetical protein BBJ41_30265 [Burkholderia stabilis]